MVKSLVRIRPQIDILHENINCQNMITLRKIHELHFLFTGIEIHLREFYIGIQNIKRQRNNAT